MKKNYQLLIVVTIPFVSLFPHRGRTDAYGGHHDYQNRSGLGSYHYHHGMGPHLHNNGVCPYSRPVQQTFKPSYSDNHTVKMAQIKLNQLGYPCGVADGILGEKTRNAILEFQRDYGIPQTGKLCENTLMNLEL